MAGAMRVGFVHRAFLFVQNITGVDEVDKDKVDGGRCD